MQKKRDETNLCGITSQDERGTTFENEYGLELQSSLPAQSNRKSWSKLEADQSVENRLDKLRQKRASRVSRLSTTKNYPKYLQKALV